MIRFWSCLVALAIAQPVWASGDDAPYYGPMQRWHGIGLKFGYEDRFEKDGSWRVDAAVHNRGDAIDIAMYRMAERGRDQGYRYVFFLGGSGSRSPGLDAATVYARPSHDAVPPVGCRSKKVTTCYTADVAEVLRMLGGPDGMHPGVPIVDHRDDLGRAVLLSGYGTGGIASPIPGAVPRSHVMTIIGNRSRGGTLAVVPPAPIPEAIAPRPVGLSAARPATAPGGLVAISAAERFEQARKANQPVRGRDPTQGWAISD